MSKNEKELAMLAPPPHGQIVIGAFGKVEMAVSTLEEILDHDEITDAEIKAAIEQWKRKGQMRDEQEGESQRQEEEEIHG